MISFCMSKNLFKYLIIFIFTLLLPGNSLNASDWGKGELKLSDFVLKNLIKYLKGKGSKTPYMFAVSVDGQGYQYYYCGSGHSCQGGDEQILTECSKYSNGTECKLFARGRTIKWKNGINPGKGKASKFKSKWSEAEMKAKLTELGFLGSATSSTSSNTTSSSSTETKKKKVVKKYELKGERSIALSWEGYDDLIAGTVKFDESDYKGSISTDLPNNDGTCEGTYSLQEGGKGTWQIACSNNMGAAGTLKWSKDGAVTGKGRDHADKKVKFTVSKKS